MQNIFLTWGLFILVISSVYSCENAVDKNSNSTVQAEVKNPDTAYFASGCFWCVEAVFESVIGVEEVVSGYAGGSEKKPTYKQVSAGLTSHAEAVMVLYDADQIDFKSLVKVFFGSHDPTTLNRQGPDRGTQYRSIAFYSNEKEKVIIQKYIDSLEQSKQYNSPIVTEVKAIDQFWEAEKYHQNYEKRNPNDSYVRNVSIPRLNRFKEQFPELLKEGH